MYSAGSFSPKISVPLLYVYSFRLTIGFEPLAMPSSPSVLGRLLRSVVIRTNMGQLARPIQRSSDAWNVISAFSLKSLYQRTMRHRGPGEAQRSVTCPPFRTAVAVERPKHGPWDNGHFSVDLRTYCRLGRA